MAKMRILYISRRYPPSVGGMEKMAYEIYSRLNKIADVEFIIWGGSNKWLLVILPFFFLKSIYVLLTKKIDIIHIGDGSISPLLLVLMFFRKPIVATIHALDITYQNKLYQFLIPRCAGRANKVICISNYAKEKCAQRKIPSKNISIIPCGVSDEFYIRSKNKEQLVKTIEENCGISIKDKKIIISVGRLIERKGFHWFIKEIIPELLKKRKSFVYLLVGDGILKKEIKDIIKNEGLEKYVFMMGKINDITLKTLYNLADVFVMPNIKVQGDAEGFGLVALEAASCNLPVVASDIEGIKDAMEGYKKGFLISPKDKKEYKKTIENVLNTCGREADDQKDARDYILNKFDWDIISRKYLDEFSAIISEYKK